ncbi:MAG: pseudouridine synthase [Lachnospiraceae bacterium]|jgi:23S rRNA pseudouridine2604 synthase|uniref:pseudouridine synthase n=1 Tax=Candidatus Merdisoma sp. JLR.KK006 TaxID=3112626 RepID=UPI002FF2A079|nr:pseudouridine synthase [Lachnospiraceae bacterium]
MEEIRLNKFLSEAGVCSRREADRMIEEGRITVDGKKAETGMRVRPDQEIKVGKKVISMSREEEVLLAVYKPPGVICTTDRREKRNIVDYVGYPTRIYPIGRLDKDSEGLILMTNIGGLVNKMMRAANYHEKEYLVTVHKPVTEAFLERMAKGVRIRKEEKGEVLLDAMTRPCQVEKLGKYSFRIILTQGLNRQIRRMCEALGYQVTHLKRVRVLNIELKGMHPGTWRKVTDKELKELLELLRGSAG